MLHKSNGALQCPFISTVSQVKHISFNNFQFKPFIFDAYQKNNKPKYACIYETKNIPGIYVVKDNCSNKVLRFGSSKKDLYEQISLFVQHYKISSGQASIAFIHVAPELIEMAVERIKVSHQFELIDDTFFKVVPLVLEKKPISIGVITFFPLYNELPIGPRPISRVKTNIAHLKDRKGVYIFQMKPKEKNSWHIEYVGRATDLNRRIHAHFNKSQAEYRPTSNYYHLRKTHDFKIGIIEFPTKEKSLVPIVENFFIEQWDPPGNRYGRGLSKEEITALSVGYKPIDIDVTF